MKLEEKFKMVIATQDIKLHAELIEVHRSVIESIGSQHQIEDIDDFIQDIIVTQLKRNKIPPITDYGVWRAWLRRVAINAALDYNRKQTVPVEAVRTEEEEEDDISEAIESEPVEMFRVTDSVDDEEFLLKDVVPSPRDRAVIRLSYGIEPFQDEWKALARHAGCSVRNLQARIDDTLLLNHNLKMTHLLEKISKSYSVMMRRHRKWQKERDHLDQLISHSDIGDSKLIELIQRVRRYREAYRDAYRRYRKAQEYKTIKIKATDLSRIIGISPDGINQILTRTRRKLRTLKEVQDHDQLR